ncbi:signal recognition particle receptor subunit alpha-like isoform X1 [Tachypleus tridentatus]|uniref:signal recognition particle receptor subunit alpha-like isoform X1 n=2 Tax=Tachypleus tridentatus TaxID=6853 RepID=UPI003FCF3736
MLDFFTIFSKSGIVLWCFHGTSHFFTSSVNALIQSVLLQERSGMPSFEHGGLTLQYKLDNEFELVFVVAYQKILQLSYIDKFLDDVHREFRDKFKEDLENSQFFSNFEFGNEFEKILASAEEYGRIVMSQPRKMRTFEESLKSKKTVASMIENKKEQKPPTKGKENKDLLKGKSDKDKTTLETCVTAAQNGFAEKNSIVLNGEVDTDIIIKNRQKMFHKMQGKQKKSDKIKGSSSKENKTKKPRVWDNSGTCRDTQFLDFSEKPKFRQEGTGSEDYLNEETRAWVGQMKGDIKGMEYSESEDELSEAEETVPSKSKQNGNKKGFGMFNMFRGLVGSKSISHKDMEPILDKLRDHMIAKNVATDIAGKLCESVASRLEGKVLGTFTGVASTVKATLVDALVQLLSPRRRVDILRDVMEAKQQQRPYVMVFCGVNGVGKSTNLAKISFWLVENNFKVLIAACDTFRAGAVEQLRTHSRCLNALHPPEKHGGYPVVQLYEKGYGKDAAGIAMEAINYARDCKMDVVLVDTAGRMQDNEPLMRALAKLIKVNSPDLVLFVGEALVGNEAVDQLVKFNQALADHSSQEKPHLIDGIVLTKFDTIDDKVGAAISMTYITGQPIVFVGTGQTYTDLKNLNAKAVVHALMK